MSKAIILSSFLLAMTAVPASAAFVTVDLAGKTNGSWAIQGFAVPGGAQTLGGIPFLIDTSGGDALYWTGAGSDGATSLTLEVSIYGAANAYTLINNFWGDLGVYQSVTFNATGGLSKTFALYGDVDVRDFFEGTFANSINGTTTQQVLGSGPHRLDRQYYALPTAFRSQTLTSVVFNDFGMDSLSRLTLTGVTIETGVPEPASWAMLIVGFGLVGSVLRRRATPAMA